MFKITTIKVDKLDKKRKVNKISSIRKRIYLYEFR